MKETVSRQYRIKNKKDSQQEPDLTPLKVNWGSPFVERQHVSKFSGGILHPRTLSNLDAKGEGPSKRIRIGKKVAYPVDSLIEWMQARAVTINPRVKDESQEGCHE